MDWCSVYLTPQALPKYIYLSPPLIFPTTYNGIRTKNRPVWITPGAAPIRWMGPIRKSRWEQKRTEGYLILSINVVCSWLVLISVYKRYIWTSLLFNISLYYTLRFYFPYLSLLSQPVTILLYGPARYLHYFR